MRTAVLTRMTPGMAWAAAKRSSTVASGSHARRVASSVRKTGSAAMPPPKAVQPILR